MYECHCGVQPAKKAKLAIEGVAGCTDEAHQMSTSTNPAGSCCTALLHLTVITYPTLAKICAAQKMAVKLDASESVVVAACNAYSWEEIAHLICDKS